MKKLLFILLLIPVSGWSQAIAKIAQTGCASVAGANCTTSPAVSGTGGNFIVVITSDSSGGSTAISDSSSNVYTQCGSTQNSATLVNNLKVFYKAGATVTGSMTFTATATSSVPSMLVGIFSNVATSTPCDQSTGAQASSVTSVQPGIVVPTVNGELVVTAIGFGDTHTGTAISSPYTFTNTGGTDFEQWVNASNYGSAIGFTVQTGAVGTNPTWNWTNGAVAINSIIATFKPLNTTSFNNSQLMLVGVGQ